MATEATTGEASASTPSPVSTISGADLLRAAEIMDGYRDEGDDDTTAQEDAALAEASGDRGPGEAGAETKDKQDKAEPSAEKQKPEQRPEERRNSKGQLIDEKGRFKPIEAEQEPTPESTEESKYSKAKKEEERQRNLLANFEKDKAAFRAEQEQIRKELAAQRAEVEKFKQIPRSTDGTPYEFNSKQYSKAADDFYARGKKALAEGDIEESNKLFAQAEQCSQAAEQVWQVEQQHQQQQQAKQLVTQWEQNRDALIAKEPDLAWSEEAPTPLNLAIKEILEAPGNEFLHYLPHGFSIAAQVAKWKLGDAERSALSEKLQAAEAEVSRLQKLTGIRTAPSSGMPKPKGTGDMSRDEFGSWLQEQARIADAA